MNLSNAPNNLTNGVLARIHFYKTEDGGRGLPLPSDKLHCLFEIGREMYDCRLPIKFEGKEICLGDIVDFPIHFLRPELVIEKIRAGARFNLYDGRKIAEGEVLTFAQIDPYDLGLTSTSDHQLNP
jgi:hypothetical protein